MLQNYWPSSLDCKAKRRGLKEKISSLETSMHFLSTKVVGIWPTSPSKVPTSDYKMARQYMPSLFL